MDQNFLKLNHSRTEMILFKSDVVNCPLSLCPPICPPGSFLIMILNLISELATFFLAKTKAYQPRKDLGTVIQVFEGQGSMKVFPHRCSGCFVGNVGARMRND